MQNQETPFLNSLVRAIVLTLKILKIKSPQSSGRFLGKTFLIQDSLKLINWTLTSESKKLGNTLVIKHLHQNPWIPQIFPISSYEHKI